MYFSIKTRLSSSRGKFTNFTRQNSAFLCSPLSYSRSSIELSVGASAIVPTIVVLCFAGPISEAKISPQISLFTKPSHSHNPHKKKHQQDWLRASPIGKRSYMSYAKPSSKFKKLLGYEAMVVASQTCPKK